MNGALAVLLPPRGRRARRRWALVTAGCAVAGALLVLAARTTRATWQDDLASSSLSPFVAEGGLRGGTVVATVLFALPFVVLALQALQLGADVRARRGRALRLAGATTGQVRTVAAVEAAACAGLGGLLAGPLYLLLHVLLGLPPRVFRFALPLQAGDLGAWALVTVLLAGTGALVAARTAPEGRGPSGRPRRWGWGAAVGALGLLVAAGVVLRDGGGGAAAVLVGLVVLLLVGLVALAAPVLLRWWARVAVRRSDAAGVLVAHRLAARPGTAGRACAVLVAVGATLGVTVPSVVLLLRPDPHGFGTPYDHEQLVFYVGGTALVGVLALLGAVLVLATLGFSLADDLARSGRQFAALRALGVTERELRRVLARQAAVGAVPAVVAGALVPVLLRFSLGGPSVATTAWTLAVAVAAGLLVRLACGLLALVLTGPLRRACATGNLRTA